MGERYKATQFSAFFYAWMLAVTGMITWLSGDPNPIVGCAIAALIWMPAIAFIDWETGK